MICKINNHPRLKSGVEVSVYTNQLLVDYFSIVETTLDSSTNKAKEIAGLLYPKHELLSEVVNVHVSNG